MNRFFKSTPLERELLRLKNEERRYLEKRKTEKQSRLNALLEDKVPDKLQDTLDNAFGTAFSLIFQKGTGIIEKTYDKEKITEDSREGHRQILRRQDRRSLRNVTGKAGGSGIKNMVLSGAAGIGMGVVGAGLPDIPVFTAMILKSIYEIALQYGFSYETEEEKYFILLLIRGAIAEYDDFTEIDKAVDTFIETELLPMYYSREGEIRSTAAQLSKEMLYMKFLQGTMIVGAIGGVYDVIYMKRITEYAELKYRRRFYNKMIEA